MFNFYRKKHVNSVTMANICTIILYETVRNLWKE